MPVKTSKEHDDFVQQINDLRYSSLKRFKNNFDNIIEKYSKVPMEGRDVVDLRTLEIVEDYGQIKNMKRRPYGHYSSKFPRPKKDRKKLKELLKMVQNNSEQNNGSFCEDLEAELSEEMHKKVIDMNFCYRNLKIPLLEDLSCSKSFPRNSRDSLTLKEDVLINNNDIKNSKLQVIKDLFTCKVRNFENLKFNLSHNISPNNKESFTTPTKEKQCESKITVSEKKRRTQLNSNDLKNRFDAYTSPSRKKKADVTPREKKQHEHSSISSKNITSINTALDKNNSFVLGCGSSKVSRSAYTSPGKKRKSNITISKDIFTSNETMTLRSSVSKKSSIDSNASKVSFGANISTSKKKKDDDILYEDCSTSNENMTPRNISSKKLSWAQLQYDASKTRLGTNISLGKKKKSDNDSLHSDKNLEPRTTSKKINGTQPSFDASKTSLGTNDSASKKNKTDNTPGKEKQYKPRYTASDRINRIQSSRYSSKMFSSANTFFSEKKKANNISSKDSLIINKLRIINDLFTYKTKDFAVSKISFSADSSPCMNKQAQTIPIKENHRENCSTVDKCITPRHITSDRVNGYITPSNTSKEHEDILTSNKCVLLKTPASHKYQIIENLFNYSTPTQQKFKYLVMQESPRSPQNVNLQVDDLLSHGTPSIKKSLENSSKRKTLTLNKYKHTDVNRKKSQDSISVCEKRTTCHLTNSKRYESTVTPINNQMSMNNLPQVRKKGDDLSNYDNIQKRLFYKDN